MNKQKYSQILQTFESIKAQKDSVDTLASLDTILQEATDTQGMIKIIIERNKQELTIPAALLRDYVQVRKTTIESDVDALLSKVDIK